MSALSCIEPLAGHKSLAAPKQGLLTLLRPRDGTSVGIFPTPTRYRRQSRRAAGRPDGPLAALPPAGRCHLRADGVPSLGVVLREGSWHGQLPIVVLSHGYVRLLMGIEDV